MSKYIKDPIYPDYLKFSEDELKLIDNPAFKRLRRIKQLGSLDEVFPGASHSRAAHSMGVAHLSETFTRNLFDNSDMLLRNGNIRTLRNIKIAGLYHDIGHGPFSHVFDSHVLYKLCPNNINKDHEIRSCNILEQVCSVLDSTKFTGYDIDFIKNAINPLKDEHDYRYQIIANKVNSIDVDKFDYLMRDPYHIGFNYAFDYTRLCNKTKIINDKIYFHENVSNDIFDMYYTRYKFHREIYNHKAVKAIELMIGDILLDSNDIYNFPAIINSKEFIELDDTILTRIKYNPEKSLNSCRELIKRIETRDIYKEIYNSNTTDINEVEDYISDTFKDEIKENFHFVKMNFDFCNGDSSPFNNINFYKDKSTIVNSNELNIRKLIPNNFKESIIAVYRKNNL